MGEFLGQQFRVGVADAKSDHGAGVAEHGLPDFGRELVEVLVGEGQAQPILAGFGQNRRKAVGCEVVEFVNEQIEVAAIGFGRVGAGHGAQLKLRGEQGAEQVGFVGAEFAFRQVRDKDAAGVDHEAEVDFRFHLAENVSDGRVHEELADFVLNRCDSFAHEPWIVASEFVRPIAAHKRGRKQFPKPRRGGRRAAL